MRRVDQSTVAVAMLQLRFTAAGSVWLFVALGVGASAWWKSINLVLVIAYVMIALLVMSGVLSWLAVRRTEAVRLRTPPAFAGERTGCLVRVTNHSTLPVTVVIEDRAGPVGTAFLLYRLQPHQVASCAAPRVFPRRGRYTGPVVIASEVPFGFVRCERVTDPDGAVVVLPRLGIADPDGLRRWLLRRTGSDDRARRIIRRATAELADVRGVREYRPGDPLRAVHWRSTARSGETMVREYDIAPSPDLVLVVEPWLPPQPTSADTERLEAALSLAVTVALTWRREFDRAVTVVVPGPVPTVATGVSEEALREALAPLAETAGAVVVEPVSPVIFGRHLGRAARIVVSSRPDSPYAAALFRATGRVFLTACPTDRLPWYVPPAEVSSAS